MVARAAPKSLGSFSTLFAMAGARVKPFVLRGFIWIPAFTGMRPSSIPLSCSRKRTNPERCQALGSTGSAFAGMTNANSLRPRSRAGSSCSPPHPQGSHGPDRPDLDRACLGPRAARRPGEGPVEIGRLDQVIAAELLLDLGIGAVQHRFLAVLRPNDGRRVARLQPFAADPGARFLHRLGGGAVGGEARLCLLFRRRLHGLLVLVDHQQIAHRWLLTSGLAFFAS